ncbi:MAG: carboxypeptidase regulatory-like domain-containing protein [Vicinamibacterales bacterium]
MNIKLALHVALYILSALIATAASAQTTGTLRGTITDQGGGALPGADVTLVAENTRSTRTLVTDDRGEFEFQALAVGRYIIRVTLMGFLPVERSGVEVVLGQTAVVTLQLPLTTAETVTVSADVIPQIQTSSTQIGGVTNSLAAANLPLNARDTYALLQLQPGVQAQIGSDSFAGSDQAGVVSVNGGRGRSNNFTVNGGDANDRYLALPAVQPTPDAIEEFRVITGAFDAEFGRSAGSVINVVTKSGTNSLRGNVFEFFRDEGLDSRGYFDTTKAKFSQHQYGLTLGGPLRRDRTFFFGSLERRQIVQGVASDVVGVPTPNERLGDCSAGAPFTGTLASSFLASHLSARPGCADAIAAAGGAPLAPGASYASLFPGNRIPLSCTDATALAVLDTYVPFANTADGRFQAVPDADRRNTQGTLKIDHALTTGQQLTAFIFGSRGREIEPFARLSGSGANLPGFGNATETRTWQAVLGHTWARSRSSVVNEFRFTTLRQSQPLYNSPITASDVSRTCGALPPDQCFADPTQPGVGIRPRVGAAHEGLPLISVAGGFSIGNNAQGEIPQTQTTFQIADTLSRTFGAHSLKIGADVRRTLYDMTNYGALNGQYGFVGGGPNDVGYDTLYPNVLLGLPDTYYQTAPSMSQFRYTTVYAFAQDTWRPRPGVTVNAGLRYELTTPPANDVLGRTQSVRLHAPSTQFPCALSPTNPLVAVFGTTDCNPGSPGEAVFPLGLVVPGDPGVEPGLSATYKKGFAPRAGLAWSPQWSDGWKAALTGGPDRSSIRAGWGIYYDGLVEGLILAQLVPQPPYGGSSSIANGLFSTPLLGQDGTRYANPFDGILAPQRGEPVDFSVFRPILLYGQQPADLKPQYAHQYHVTVQRQLPGHMMAQAGYVGTLGRRLLATRDINPGMSETCLDLNQIPGMACGPFGADSTYVVPANAIPEGVTLRLPYGSVPFVTGPNPEPITLVGLRPYSSPFCEPTTGRGCPPDGIPVFSSLFQRDNLAESRYDALQTLVEKRFSRGLQFQAVYTLSTSVDTASSFENIVNPFDVTRSRALSLFHARHRFVLNAYWEVPYTGHPGLLRALDDWSLSPIITLQSGFPIRITASDDRELLTSVDFEMPGQPDQITSLLPLDPRQHGDLYFDPATFAPQALGTIGNAPRTVCCGPGIRSIDIALQRSIRVSTRARLQLRAEVFNLLNTVNFNNPVGDISDRDNFGRVLRAKAPRQVQLAVKLFY